MCLAALLKQPHLLTLQQDRDKFRRDQTTYVAGWAFLAMSIPAQLFCAFKLAKDPMKNRKYLVGGAYISTFALGFFFWSAYKH